MALTFVERRRPPRNSLAWGGLAGWCLARAQMFADLQVATVSADVKAWLRRRHGSVVEVGCGDQPYRRQVPARCEYVGIDRRDMSRAFNIKSRNDVIYYGGEAFPVDDERFDSLFHTDVLEHVYEARTFLGECRRALKSGGEMFFTVPFQARYHYAPNDFFRYTPSALERLLTEVGFEAITISPRGNDITVAAYKAAAVGFRWAYGGPLAKLLFVATAPLTILALAVAHAAHALRLGSSDDCLGYSVSAKRAALPKEY